MFLQLISIPLMKIRQLKQIFLEEAQPFKEFLRFFKNF